MSIQATKFLAQLNDGTKMNGGQEGIVSNQYPVSAVPIPLLKVFTVTHNTFSHTYYVPLKTWYKDGKVWSDYAYPTVYGMQDGSTVTVDLDPETGLLELS